MKDSLVRLATLLSVLLVTTGLHAQDESGPRVREGMYAVAFTKDGAIDVSLSDSRGDAIVQRLRPHVESNIRKPLETVGKPVESNETDLLGESLQIAQHWRVESRELELQYRLYPERDLLTVDVIMKAGDEDWEVRSVDLQGKLSLNAGQTRWLWNNERWQSRLDRPGNNQMRSDFWAAGRSDDGSLAAVLGAMEAESEGQILAAADHDHVAFILRANYGGPGAGKLTIKAGSTARTGRFAILLGDDEHELLEAYGRAVRDLNEIKLYRPIPAGWCSWDAYNWGVSAEKVDTTLDIIEEKKLVDWGLNVMQIDDGWQNGWRVSGDWRVQKQRFPDGLSPIAKRCDEMGLMMGLWVAPFYDEDMHSAVDETGKIKKGSPGWMRNAQPVLTNYPEFMTTSRSGEPTGNYDISMPEFLTHLEDLNHRLTYDYGADYIKTDFIAYGYGIQADRSLPHHTVYRNALKAQRAGMKPGTYWMTCIAHEFKSLGIADAQRIGNDVNGRWKGIHPTLNRAAAWYFMNGNFWWNDLDQLHVHGGMRKRGNEMQPWGLTLDQARAWAGLMALHGSITLTGDRLDNLTPERLDLLRRTWPPTGQTARPIDLFDVATGDKERRWPSIYALELQRDFGHWWIVGLFNWTDEPHERSIRRADLPGVEAGSLLVYDIFERSLLPEMADTCTLPVRPTAGRLLAVHPKPDARPIVLATSRHLMAGAVDLADVTWAPEQKTLSGKSKTLVADEAFWIDIYVPEGMAARDARVADKTVSLKQDGRVARMEFTAPAPTVTWKVRFQADAASAE